MGKSKSQKMEVNDYWMSLHMGICWGPVDEISAIYIGEKLAWEGVKGDDGGIIINQPYLFGGNKKEGGTVGQAYFFKGFKPGEGTFPDQLAYRLGRNSGNCPAFNGLSSLFFVQNAATYQNGFNWASNSPYVRPVWVTIKRISNVFTGDPAEYLQNNYHNMGSQANPAHMIFECLINTDWGMGYDPVMLDLAAFRLAAKVLYQENFGLSMVWMQQSTIESFVGEILDHIYGTLFVDPRSGLLTLKLVRADYLEYNLKTLTPDNCRVTRFERKAWAETINEINVTWTNPINEEEETFTVHDLANIEMQGGVVSDTRNYYGIRSGELAAMVASRDIRTAAAPLATFEVEANREAFDLVPGGCFKLTYPEYGITNLVLRITNIDYGRPGDSVIKITSLEDIFAQPQSSWTAPPPSQWVDPSSDPTDLEYVRIMTLPLYMSAVYLSQQTFDVSEYPEVLAGVLGASENDDTRSFELYGDTVTTDGSIDMEQLGTKPIVSHTNTITGLAAEATTTITGFNLGVPNRTRGDAPTTSMFVLIGTGVDDRDELALITAVSPDFSSVTLARGVLDTVPRAWPAGTQIWFLPSADTWGDGIIYSDGSVARYKALPSTSRGTLALDSASQHTFYMSGRPYYPTRPGNVKVGSVGFGVYTHNSTSDLNVTWSNRNRLTEDAQVVLWQDGNITPEADQTTTVRVYNQYGGLLTTHNDITGTSFAVPITDFGTNTSGFIRVSSERDGFESLQYHEIEVVLDL